MEPAVGRAPHEAPPRRGCPGSQLRARPRLRGPPAVRAGSSATIRAAGLGAAALWCLLCLRWFDAALPWRPHWLGVLPPWALAMGTLGALLPWLPAHLGEIAGPPLARSRRGLWLVLAVAGLFRLPHASAVAVGTVQSYRE